MRTVGVLVRDAKLLVQRERDGSEYASPGGHVKIGETTADGLVREFKEETGADIKVEKLLWTEECFWEWNGTQAHNIAFYYLIQLADESDIPDTGEFESNKDNCNVVLGWMPIKKLANGINPIDDSAVQDENVINHVRLSRCFFYVADTPPLHSILFWTTWMLLLHLIALRRKRQSNVS